MRVKGRLTLCSDSGCDHGREMYLIVNPSLNAMFITLTIHCSSINVSKGMNEMTCWKMPCAPSQGHTWTINVRCQTVENTRTRLIFPLHLKYHSAEEKSSSRGWRASWWKPYSSRDYNMPHNDKHSCVCKVRQGRSAYVDANFGFVATSFTGSPFRF